MTPTEERVCKYAKDCNGTITCAISNINPLGLMCVANFGEGECIYFTPKYNHKTEK